MRNDPKLVQAIIDFTRECFEDRIVEKVESFAYFYEGDSCNFTLKIDIDRRALKLLARLAGAELPKYPKATLKSPVEYVKTLFGKKNLQ